MRFVALFQRGVYTQIEFNARVLHALTDANAPDFIERCPDDVLPPLREYLVGLPADDDEAGWATRLGFSGGHPRRTETEDDVRRIEVEARQALRLGARAFRAALAQRRCGTHGVVSAFLIADHSQAWLCSSLVPIIITARFEGCTVARRLRKAVYSRPGAPCAYMEECEIDCDIRDGLVVAVRHLAVVEDGKRTILI